MGVKVLNFTIFLIHKLANAWKVSPDKVYSMLNSSGILDNYIVKCYDVLHTLGAEVLYLIYEAFFSCTILYIPGMFCPRCGKFQFCAQKFFIGGRFANSQS